ncbi:MAG: arginine--tRNA ligase [Candidatus Pacebacteria bacterium]|nr:arginine--tRNA ligase [Candidatus Paceibacterota bacterium]
MEQKIKNWIKEILKIEGDFVLTHPKDLKNGDYTFISSLENAKESLEKLEKNKLPEIEKIEMVGRFINFHLSRKFFANRVEEILNNPEDFGKNNSLEGKKIMVEYTDPNPFKPFHIGHLMSNAIGESISRLVEFSGAKIARANFQGDLGLHVAKAIYGLMDNEKLQSKAGSNALQASNIGKAYARGAELYEIDEEIKKEIDEINKKLYIKEDDKKDKKITEIYEWGFRVTMETFEDLYKMLGTKFDFYFLESVMADIGREIVNANMGIFEESDGAIVFKAEKYDSKLHTRVFITSAGLPTYETKDLGLAEEKFKTFPDMDLSIMVTANEQKDYMRVVMKAISLINKEHAEKMKHITHGMMRLPTGKMGSRKGNVITGESLLNDARDAILEKMTNRDFSPQEEEKVANDVSVSALKYSILKQGIGGDIIYDFEKSISFEGDSGPYLQYAYARANSILEKAQKENILPDPHAFGEEIFEVEKLLYKFPEIVFRSAKEYEPHYIANYLIEVARAFNSFYGNTVIVNKEDSSSGYKISLTYAFSFVMKNGLYLLGITAPKKM